MNAFLSQAVFWQAVFWFLYVLVGYKFFSFISQHAIALYLTRGSSDGVGRLRLFVQNLEDVPLTGDFRLEITLPQGAPIDPSTLVIRAGPKKIKEDLFKIASGTWSILFKRLPAHDTWLFELDAESDMAASVRIIAAPPTPPQDVKEGSDASIFSVLKKILPTRTAHLPQLATSTVLLREGESHVVAGAHATPKFGALLWVLALGIGLQLLATWAIVSTDTCQILASWGGDDKGACQSLAVAFPSQYDFYIAVSLAVFTALSFLACRRSPTPIAQGYLERTKTDKSSASCLSPAAPETP